MENMYEKTDEDIEQIKKKVKKLRLPNKLIAMPNPDKKFHEHWDDNRNMLNIPHPYRLVCVGKPNVGKTTVVKNLLLRARPEFEEVFVIHCDGGYTKEYNDIDTEILNHIPPPDSWEGEVKTLVIIDDLDLTNLSKEQKGNLDRLFGYCSTHKNISVVLCSQNFTNIPAICRRCANFFVIWKTNDMDAMSGVGRKSGLKPDKFKSIFYNDMKGHRDSLWIDLTDGSPYPVRKNGFEVIEY